ncbi:cbb3-type cytochrome oxidase subunit 3 [Thiohalorhabdus methylotrophus]|uniref:Cbb3-type cytochrome oxidase subunit 3 n=1 Tax=Thiohalorhabdus methylotrophus TaxID=3242694 RepID=A0ABV4TPU8_9GAMM
MTELFAWFSDALTDMQKAGQIATVIFFAVFTAILVYVFTGKKRKKRFDSYRYIPLDDDEQKGSGKDETGEGERKGSAEDGQQ